MRYNQWNGDGYTLLNQGIHINGYSWNIRVYTFHTNYQSQVSPHILLLYLILNVVLKKASGNYYYILLFVDFSSKIYQTEFSGHTCKHDTTQCTCMYIVSVLLDPIILTILSVLFIFFLSYSSDCFPILLLLLVICCVDCFTCPTSLCLPLLGLFFSLPNPPVIIKSSFILL